MILNNAPKILTAKEWNAKKGTVAKMAGETGMGAALLKLDAAYKKVPWNVIDPDAAWVKNNPTKPPTADGLRQLMPAAKAGISKVEPLRTELKAVRDLALALEKKWKASRVIPSSSAAYVRQLANEAELQFLAMKNFGSEWEKAIKSAEEKQARLRGIAMSAIKPYFVSLRKFGQEIEKNPSVELYIGAAGKGFHQNIRGLNAALERSMDDGLMSWKETHWKPMSQDAFKPTKLDEVVPKVKQVLAALGELEKRVK